MHELDRRWSRSSRVELELLRSGKLWLRQTSMMIELTEASRKECEHLLLNLGLLLKLYPHGLLLLPDSLKHKCLGLLLVSLLSLHAQLSCSKSVLLVREPLKNSSE